MGVEVGEGEAGFVEGAEEVEDVEGPAASLDLEFFEGTETLVGAADFGGGADFSVVDDGDAGVGGDFVEEDVAADPAGTAGGWHLVCIVSGRSTP